MTRPPEQPPDFKLGILEGPKRQHYVSRFYSEGFTRGGLLWLYDRQIREYRQQTPINTGVESHFYTFVDHDGRRRFDLETMLATIEGLAAPAIRALARKEVISDESRDALGLFMAFGHTRTPEFIDTVRRAVGDAHSKYLMQKLATEEQVAAGLAAIADEIPEAKNMTAAQMFKEIHSGHYKIEVEIDRQVALAKAWETAPRLALMLYYSSWAVLHAVDERTSFVTCDSPLSTLASAGLPRGMAFPLNQTTCLIASRGEPEMNHFEVNRDVVRRLNRECVANSYRFAIARDRALLESVVSSTGMCNGDWVPRHERPVPG